MTGSAEPIAIIGLGARLPGAIDVARFWSNLREGRESISFLSDAELMANGVPPVALADPDYVKALPMVPDVELFDAELFGMTAREAELCDPALRLFLEVAHATIEDAGYDVTTVGDGFGVFSASGPCHYQDHYVRQSLKYRSANSFQVSTLNNTDYSATLAAYKLDLRGPAMTIITACSSSLVALHVAAQALRQGECDAAVVGGANVETPYGQGHQWVPGAVRSQDGHCRPFDAAATGTMFGNGCAAVVIKRLSDAQRDGDNIRAVLLGSAVNNDGSDKVSFSAPSSHGQTSVIVEAMTRAGCHPRDISYVEAHGTATAMGDPMEVAALADAYRQLAGEDLPRGSIGMGSVKSNIGHLVWAAGVSEVIKVALALEHQEIPPTVNFTEPNPRLQLDATPLTVVDRLRPWPRVEGAPRRAGVSSLGIGGTNAHAVIGEAPPVPARPAAPERPRLVVWSGLSRDAVDDGRARLAGHFRDAGSAGGADALSFADATATLQRGRTAHPARAAVVGRNASEVAAALTAGRFVAGDGPVRAARPLAFVFPGQGSQYSAMATGLYDEVPHFAALVDRCLDGFAAHGVDLREAWRSSDPDALTDTVLAQPMLFTVEYALAGTLRHWGLEPAALLGHSIGELTAAAVAGVYSLDDGIRLVAARARAMGAAPRGAMVSVLAPADTVAALLPGSLVVAVRNSPNQAVVAGPSADVDTLEKDLAARGLSTRRLVTSHAFHSPMMAAAAREFLEVMRTVDLHPPRIPVVSAATGRHLTDDQARDPAFWAAQVAEPVRLDLALDTILTDPWTLLEVGPGQVLTGLARRHRGLADTALPTLGSGGGGAGGAGDTERVLEAVGRLWVGGHAVDWSNLADEPDGGFRRAVVPGYPYQRKLHWATPATGPAAPQRAGGAQPVAGADAGAAPVGAAPPSVADAEPDAPGVATPFTTVTWIEAPARPGLPAPSATALAFVPADRDEGLAVLGPLLRTGARIVRVRPAAAFSAATDEFRIRPGAPEDVKAVLDRLAADGRRPDLLVHAWGVPPWDTPHSTTVDEQLDLSFTSLLALVQHGTGRPVDGRLPRLVVLTGRAADVSGSEPLDPLKAALHGLTRTLAQEAPGVACSIIDIGPGTTEAALAAEIGRTDGPGLVALRGHRRWIPVEQPLELDDEAVALRRDGVYVVTGGLGGLGLAVGQALARTGSRPRLVLAGRRALPEESAPGAEQDAGLRRVRAAVDEMTDLGAEVRTVACDVTDPAQVGRMLDAAAAEFGPVTGVLHLAGVAGGGMLQLRAPADARAVLRPKVLGTLVLQEALRGRPELDFFVSFSSRAAVHGLVGSGDYAAANAVLDAFAAAGEGRHRRLSIGWPAWSGVGMAVEGSRQVGDGQVGDGQDSAAASGPAPLDVELTLDPAVDWVLDEHRLDGRSVLPGTGHLDLVISTFRRLGLISADDAVQVADACFQTAMVVDAAVAVRVRFTPERDRWRFEVASRAADAGAGSGWTAHSGGWISGCARKDVLIPPAALREGFTEVEPPSLRPGPGRLFALGGRWQNIDRMWRDDAARERTVQLVLPAEYTADVEHCHAHPALLDGATATVRDDTDDVHLPFMYRRAVFHHVLPPVLFSHMKRGPDKPGAITADITMVAPDGTLLAEVEGFVMRRTGRQVHFLATDPEAAETDAAVTDAAVTAPTSPAPLAAAVDLLPTAADGLDPDEGGRLLTLLLGATTPNHVLVRPHVDGRPTPIGGRTVEVARRPAAAAAPVVRATPTDVSAESASSDVMLAAVLEMWKEALGADDLGPDGEFFELGGDSLSAVQLMGRIRERFGVEMSIAVLFDCPTARELTAELVRMAAQTG